MMAKKYKRRLASGGEIPDVGLDLNKYAGAANVVGGIAQGTGSPAGNIIGGVAKGAATGAAFGPWGAAIGAGVGAISGVIGNNKAKEEEERLRQLQIQAAMKSDVQKYNNANKLYAEGGSLNNDSNITQYNGLPHGLGGIPITDEIEVENKETRGVGDTKDYIFSDMLRIANKKRTFANESKRIEKKYKGTDNDHMALEAKNADLTRLMHEQEALKEENYNKGMQKMMNQYPEKFDLEYGPDINDSVQYGEGGKIIIKPSKRGTFTAAAKKRGLGVQEFASRVLANKENYSSIMVKKANFARNASSWHMEGGVIGNELFGIGGKLNPPDGGDEKTYLRKSDYDKEVANRQQNYDVAFTDWALKKGGITMEDLNDRATRGNLMNQYKENNPFNINDLAITPDLQPLPNYGNPTNDSFNPYQNNDSQVNAVNQIQPDNSIYTVDGNNEDFGSNFDYNNKTWIPRSAAMSEYKTLMKAGKEDEAQKVVFGHFQSGKGGGQYRKSTHGKGEEMGNIKPITVGQLGEAGKHIPNANKIYDNITTYGCGGKLKYPDGGTIGDNTKKVEGIKNYNPEQLARHRQLMQDLYKQNPNSNIQDYSQYAFGATRNTDLFGSGPDRLNISNKVDPNLTWNSTQGDVTIGNIRPTLPNSVDATKAPNIPITASQFAANPEYYKGLFSPSDYEHMTNYVLGSNAKQKAPVATGGISRKEVLDLVQQDINSTSPSKVQFQSGGGLEDIQALADKQRQQYAKLNVPNPNEGMTVAQVPMNDRYSNTQGNTAQYNTDYNKYEIPYDPNKNTEDMNYADYQGKPKYWSNDKNNIYTRDYVRQNLLTNGLEPGQVDKLMNTPGYAGQFFDNLAQDKTSAFSSSEFKNDRRFGPEHVLAATENSRIIPGRENVSPIPSLGPPNFDNNQNIDMNLLQQQGYNPQTNEGPPVEDGSGNGNLKRFRPDILGSAVSAIPSIGMGIANMKLGNDLNYQKVSPIQAQADYLDPTRALQEVRDAYAGSKDMARQVSSGSGNLMSNLIGAGASQSKASASVASQYDNANAQISNQFEQYNVGLRQRSNDTNTQISNQQIADKTALKQQGYQNLFQGLNTGINTFYQSKRDADMMNMAGGENFYYKTIGPAFNQKTVKVFEGNGFHYYNDPDTGEMIKINSKKTSNGK